ncbi:unnamed protein product, partial [Iphiclides podalirius]
MPRSMKTCDKDIETRAREECDLTHNTDRAEDRKRRYSLEECLRNHSVCHIEVPLSPRLSTPSPCGSGVLSPASQMKRAWSRDISTDMRAYNGKYHKVQS